MNRDGQDIQDKKESWSPCSSLFNQLLLYLFDAVFTSGDHTGSPLYVVP